MSAPDLSRVEWRKSSRSGAGQNCVEVAAVRYESSTHVYLRDSKNPNGPSLSLTPSEWAAFRNSVKKGNVAPA